MSSETPTSLMGNRFTCDMFLTTPDGQTLPLVMKSELEALTRENNELRQRIRILENEKSTIDSQKSELKLAIDTHLTTIAELRRENTELKATLETMSQIINDLTESNQILTNQNTALTEKVDYLTQQNDDQLETKRMSTLLRVIRDIVKEYPIKQKLDEPMMDSLDVLCDNRNKDCHVLLNHQKPDIWGYKIFLINQILPNLTEEFKLMFEADGTYEKGLVDVVIRHLETIPPVTYDSEKIDPLVKHMADKQLSCLRAVMIK